MIDIENSTVEELEREQERLHEEFERCKSESYDLYILMGKLSDEYLKIDNKLEKLKGNNVNG